MKLIIQIPCLNEEATLPAVLRDLPRSLPGIDCIEFLVVDDGSTDRTVQVAKENGAHHVLSLGSNRGLGRAFPAGIAKALQLGADIVVNTDADNQYDASGIPALVAPILANRADLVVGCRPIVDHPEFGPVKKLLQRLGSSILRALSGTDIRDAASGFRAFSRAACMRIFVYSRFSYCMETLIQAGTSGIRVVGVDIEVNPSTRPSRLFKSIPEYVIKSGTTMLAMFVLYRPGKFFAVLAAIPLLGAFLLGLRYILNVYCYPVPERTYIPSLILTAILGMIGVLLLSLGVIAELLKAQRKLTEENLYLLRAQQLGDTSGSASV
ncbi:MAG: glycosyltransferase family 2 protein [Verrucomicrobia bacterium]|nr:glycosyltransferase family 2 protein [Verrucomicrobiota bacterium]